MLGVLENLQQHPKTSTFLNEGTPKKLAVRLRLKKSNGQFSDLSSTCGPICMTLRQQNNRLHKNVQKLSNIQQYNSSFVLEKLIYDLNHSYKQKNENKNKEFIWFVKNMKLILKNLYKQAENIAKISTETVIQSKQSQQSPSTNNQQHKLQADKNNTQNEQQHTIKQQKQNKHHSTSQQHITQPYQYTKQVQNELAQMQQYIIQLKQTINQKQHMIQKLNKSQQKYMQEMEDMNKWRKNKESQWKIKQEQSRGYEDKIQQLQKKIQVMGMEMEKYRLQKSSIQRKSEKNINSQQLNHTYKQQIQQQQQVQQHKLYQIYQKAQKTIARCLQLQSQKQQKQKQNKQLINKINQILITLGIKQYKEYQNYAHQDIVSIIRKYVMNKQNEYSQRQSKLQDMISSKLDQTIMLVNHIKFQENENGEIGNYDGYSVKQNKQYNLKQVSVNSQLQHLLQQQQIEQQQYKQPNPDLNLNLKKQQSSATIFDKISYLRQLLEYSLQLSQQSIVNPNLGILLILNNKLQMIMNKSQDFKMQLTSNNKILDSICKRIQQQSSEDQSKILSSQGADHSLEKEVRNKENTNEQKQINKQIINKLQLLQKLLIKNETQLKVLSQNQTIMLDTTNKHKLQHRNSNNSNSSQIIDSSQNHNYNNNNDNNNNKNEQQKTKNNVQQYLGQLESVFKNIQNNHRDEKEMSNSMIQAQKAQQQKLQEQYGKLVKIIKNVQLYLQNIIIKIRNSEGNQIWNLREVEQEISAIVEYVGRYQQYHVGKYNNNQYKCIQIDDKTIQQETIKMGNKYFPNNPDFADSLMKKIMEIKNMQDENSLFQVAQQIFNLIQNRDDKYKHELTRKRQIMKQRAAAITQICKQGKKDSSLQNSGKYTKKQ